MNESMRHAQNRRWKRGVTLLVITSQVEVHLLYALCNILLSRFCCNEKPDIVLTSTSNEAVVSFRSNFPNPMVADRKGFKLCYKLRKCK